NFLHATDTGRRIITRAQQEHAIAEKPGLLRKLFATEGTWEREAVCVREVPTKASEAAMKDARKKGRAEVQAVRDVFGDEVKILIEPGRSLVGTAGVTIYRIGTVKEIPGVRTYVAVDGGMSDNLRPMLYDAKYTAVIADRPDDPAGTTVTVAGSHCESGDILIRDVELANPRVGDILLTPATGAYGHSMSNNYNGMPRPPVIFCEDGEATVVVRRETWDDLLRRDM
ncbi:MAG TPA: hypothetical protein PLV77_06960, partial [Solirubrobacterales bacterium]|nr:hypothetical protein [Solirubrobacterales bacterium]